MPTNNELLHAASRTFALGIDLLPEPLRSEIEVAYLLLRVSDYLEDNERMPTERKVALLERWARVLDGEEPPGPLAEELSRVPDQTPDALVARNTIQVHRALAETRPEVREILVRHVRDSTLGMARWARRGPDIGDESDLDDYMHEVAGRVGWLLTEVFSLHLPSVERDRDAMMGLGREFGLALQTVNVIRGLHGDWERGWVFIPRTFVPQGADPRTLFEPGGRDRQQEIAILERLVPKAEAHLDAARGYIARIPGRERGIRLFCLLPYLFAVRTLAISRRNPRVFDEETKISRPEVKRIVFWSRLLGWSDRWVAWYARRLAR
ncbi:MAG: squalene/phytoene synthase family protein [Gemmatimonadota bacterium]